MNEHDSERLAGMLVADGMQQTDDMQQADVVVLNTCCIRENADQKLYGTLGSLKTLVDARPGVQIAVGGCLAQKDRELIQQKVGWVDVVFGTHNLTSAPELLRRAEHEGQVMEILDAPTPESISNHLMAPDAVRELPYAAWVNIQMGCDNSCAFCVVPSVRGPEAQSPPGRHRGRSGSTGSARGDRGDPVGAERQLVPGATSHDAGRCSPTCCARSAPSRASAGFGSQARTRRTYGPRRSRPWRRYPRYASSCICPCNRGAIGCWRLCAAATRPNGTWSGWPRPRSAIDDLGVTTDIIVGFPGETEQDFEDTLAVVADAAYDDAYTFIFSPRPGTRAAAMQEEFIAAEVISERFDRLKAVVDRSSLARHQERVGRTEELLVEGVSRRDESMLSGRTRQGKLVHFAPTSPGMSGTPTAGALANVVITAGHPHHLSGRLLEVTSRPRHRVRIPLASA